MNYLESLKWRYATKKFDAQKRIEPEVLDRIIEAGGLTATSLGLQAIKILRLEDENLREAILPHCFNQRQVVDASDLLILCVDTDIDQNKIDAYINLVAKTRNQHIDDLQGFKKMISGYLSSLRAGNPCRNG